MLTALLLLGVAHAQPTDPPQAEPDDDFAWVLPEAPSPVAEECSAAVDLVVGQPVPADLLDKDGNVRCYATVVPTSDLSHLLLVDAWAARAAPRGVRLRLERDWHRDRSEQLAVALAKPAPWLQRPGTQRVIGNVEAVGLMALAIGVYAVLDRGVAEVQR